MRGTTVSCIRDGNRPVPDCIFCRVDGAPRLYRAWHNRAYDSRSVSQRAHVRYVLSSRASFVSGGADPTFANPRATPGSCGVARGVAAGLVSAAAWTVGSIKSARRETGHG